MNVARIDLWYGQVRCVDKLVDCVHDDDDKGCLEWKSEISGAINVVSLAELISDKA